MNKKLAVLLSIVALVSACASATAPARSDTACRGSGVSISSGRTGCDAE